MHRIAASPTVLDVWSDIACPFCYIGQRHLMAALDDLETGSVLVRHRAFELQPALPPRGVPAAEFFAAKFGPAGSSPAFDRVTQMGAAVGIAFDFERMPVAPNTRLAHRAALLFAGQASQPLVVEALFSAYFEQGRDVTDLAVVADCASTAAGVQAPDVEQRLEAGEALDAVEADLLEARRLGVSAVPTFVADERYAVQGAQPASVLRQFLLEAGQRLAS